MVYTVRLNDFEGPLDLLLHLIAKDELDIRDIPMVSITNQYIEHLNNMKEFNLEITSEFVMMAATLLAIKARTLLPVKKDSQEHCRDEQEQLDPRQELVQRLLEYKQFKVVAEFLKERQNISGKVFTRNNKIELYQSLFHPVAPLTGIDILQLVNALQQVLKRVTKVELPKIAARELKVTDQMTSILRRLLLYPDGILFGAIFREQITRIKIVVSFLAILELLRTGQIEIKQDQQFAEIMILPIKLLVTKDGGNDDIIIS
ncbi:MAG: segregation/condensation protein A [Desulfotomaculum sp.]|nr:segregation/condensation protein A [Desulfotomaculum sp.]